MADIQHKDLPDNLLHEPKHIKTASPADAGKVITPSSATSGESVLRSLTYDEIVPTPSSPITGWARYQDGPATRTYAIGSWLPVLNDSLGASTYTAQTPSDTPSGWWSNDSGSIYGNEGELLLFTLSSANSNDADFRILLGDSTAIELENQASGIIPDHYFCQVLLPIDPLTASTGALLQVKGTAQTIWQLSRPTITIVRLHRGS